MAYADVSRSRVRDASPQFVQQYHLGGERAVSSEQAASSPHGISQPISATVKISAKRERAYLLDAVSNWQSRDIHT